MEITAVGSQGMPPRPESGKMDPEIRDFFDQVRGAVEDGLFDAAELAKGAPESLVELAEAKGTDVETMLNDMKSKIENGEMPPPPPPGQFPGGKVDISPFGQMSQLLSSVSGDEKEELLSFGKTLHEAIRNDSFDAAALAEDAPDALKEYSEEEGINLQTMLQDMYDKMTEMKANGYGPPLQARTSTE